RRIEVILHGHDRPFGIDDTEIDHGAHLDREVGARDDGMGRHSERDGLHADLHHPVDDRDQQNQSRPIAGPTRVENRARRPTEAKDHRPLVLAEDPGERAHEEEQRHHHHQDKQGFYADHYAPPPPALTTLSVSPSTSTTRTGVPASTASPSATARQSSPWIATWPDGASASRTTPTCPMSPDAPSGGRPSSARTPAATTNRNTAAVAPTVGAITHHEMRNPISVAS